MQTKNPADIGAAMKADEVAALRREAGELKEKLDAASARECVSCGARFEKGEGHACMPEDKDGKKDKGDKKFKAKSEPAEKAEPKSEPEAKKEESIFDDFIGPDEE